MLSRFRVVFVLVLLILSFTFARVDAGGFVKDFSLSRSSPTNNGLISGLHRAKQSGNIAAARSIQRQLDEAQEIQTISASDCDSRIYPLRTIPSPVRSKSFGSDVYVSASGNFESAPSIATTSTGIIFAAFLVEDSEHPHRYIAVVKSDDGGGTWYPLIQITNEHNDLNYPQIAVGEGDQDWVFVSFHTSGNDVQVARFSFSGAAGEIHSIDGSSFTSKFNARIITDNDSYYYVYVAYIRSNIWGTDVHLARSTDFGITWSQIDFTDEGAEYCDIAYTDMGGLVVVAQTESGVESSIWSSRSADYGLTWSDGQIVSSSGAYPRIAASGGNVAIVFT
ncbi:hypothetical protein DRQ26_07035, partial [bacterium]